MFPQKRAERHCVTLGSTEVWELAPVQAQVSRCCQCDVGQGRFFFTWLFLLPTKPIVYIIRSEEFNKLRNKVSGLKGPKRVADPEADVSLTQWVLTLPHAHQKCKSVGHDRREPDTYVLCSQYMSSQRVIFTTL